MGMAAPTHVYAFTFWGLRDALEFCQGQARARGGRMEPLGGGCRTYVRQVFASDDAQLTPFSEDEVREIIHQGRLHTIPPLHSDPRHE